MFAKFAELWFHIFNCHAELTVLSVNRILLSKKDFFMILKNGI